MGQQYLWYLLLIIFFAIQRLVTVAKYQVTMSDHSIVMKSQKKPSFLISLRAFQKLVFQSTLTVSRLTIHYKCNEALRKSFIKLSSFLVIIFKENFTLSSGKAECFVGYSTLFHLQQGSTNLMVVTLTLFNIKL